MLARRALTLAYIAGIACSPDLQIRGAPIVACIDDSQCPEGLVCVVDIARCRSPGDACVVDAGGTFEAVGNGVPCDFQGSAGVCVDGRCSESVCGDGIHDLQIGTEVCDAGPMNSDTTPNACREDCTPAACGDGVTDSAGADGPEMCDDGNRTSGDGCRADCGKREVCGDGLLDEGEACDDDNTTPGDGCDAGCAREMGWACGGEPSVCTRCGNGIIEGAEACDDGNPNPGDGCSDICVLEVGWDCTRTVTTVCTTVCGDTFTRGLEVCDDGNTDDCAGNCLGDCTAVAELRCGDGVTCANLMEDCDDGPLNSDSDPDACRVACVFAGCGDGVIDAGEECDDGDTDDGDGCSMSCAIETGFGCGGPAGSQCGAVIYVDASVGFGGDGTSWATAYDSLQDALADPRPVTQIWVAAGTYTPDYASGTSSGDVNATFRMRNDLAILGGFFGDEVNSDDRDPVANPTLLSGDLAGDDDGDLSMGCPARAYCENSHNVVLAQSVSRSTLDGFRISGGNSPVGGGGLHIFAPPGLEGFSRPTIRNVHFEGNRAHDPASMIVGSGGALYNQGGEPLIEQCTFVNNRGEHGGALYSDAEMVIRDSTFDGNVAADNSGTGNVGGAIFTNTGLTISGSSFTGNNADVGGAMRGINGANIEIDTTRFLGNDAGTGGAIQMFGNATLICVDCDFQGNTAANGAGADIGLNASALFLHSRFAGNQASASGGAIGNPGLVGSIWVRNSVFTNNTANLGGALYLTGPDRMFSTTGGAITNSSFFGNSATTAGNAVWLTANSDLPPFYNNVIWGNGGTSSISATGQLVSCCTDFAFAGPGVIMCDPMFGDPDGGDNTPGTLDDDLSLGTGSGAIDVGDNALVPGTLNRDILGNPRITEIPMIGGDTRVDMGAYEAQP